MWALPGSREPINFWALNPNNSKTAKCTNFKFGRRVLRDSLDMSLANISEKWAWSRSHDPVNFLAINANSSKMAKGTNFKFGALNANSSKIANGANFKFGRCVQRDSADML